MSYKTELQYNNIDLQGLIDLADTLPEAENLTDELNTQDNLIEQILTELDNKSSVPLPELSNPASAEQIVSGYEAINGDGEVVTGSYESFSVNGLIESYKVAAGENISAGDFVSYLNGEGSTGTDKSIFTGDITAVCAITLDNNRVFITYSYDAGGEEYLYATVCTVSETTIIAGSNKQLSSKTYSGRGFNTILLSNNKVFIAHSYDQSTYLYGMVCTISGTTITAGTDTKLSSKVGSGERVGLVKLTDNKVLIAYAPSNNLYSMICTISGTAVTAGTEVTLSTSSYIAMAVDTVKLSENKIFITHTCYSSNNYYLYGTVITINNTTISAGTPTQLSNINGTMKSFDTVALEENKVLVVQGSTSSIDGIICTISGTTITAGTYTELATAYADNYSTIGVVLLNSGKIIVAYGTSSYYLHYIPVTVNGTSITTGAAVKLSSTTQTGRYISTTLLNGDRVFISHSYGSNEYLYAIAISFLEGVTSLSNTVFGVAKTSGVEGEEIEIYVP